MIYLDNSATTHILPEVFEAMKPYLMEEYGNPSSKYYGLAVDAKMAVEQSREAIARLIHAKPEEIVFTCGATESTNMILKGVSDYKKYYEKKGNHIITSKTEHHATLNTCRYLNGEIYSNQDATFSLFGGSQKVDRGFRVSFLDVNEYGQVEPEVFRAAIEKETVLASFIWANNEIGSLNDVKNLAQIAHQADVSLHVDATQALGKMVVDVKEQGMDFMSFSAHKLNGPKGIGAAYIRGDIYGLPPISAFMHGGEQENGLRAGTLAVHNIVGFGKAAELALARQEQKEKKMLELDQAARSLISQCSHLELLGDTEHHINGLLSIVVHVNRFDNERFIRRISHEFAVSTGSACTAGKPSHVLEAIGRAREVSKVLRISLGEHNTIDDVRQLLELLK